MDINSTELVVVRGSMLDQDVDAVVNAAGKSMRGGGGIDGLIHRKAGTALLDELVEVAPRGAETGTAVVTRGHALAQPFIIHTPGPRWRDGEHGEPDLLASSYRSCLEAADARELTSIAFCSISTGAYRFPLERAAEIGVDTIIAYLKEHPETSLRRVVLAMYGQEEFQEFTRVLASRVLSQP